ncbi:TonB-dependent receptor [Hymenobacter sp. UV11]|uniref:TonB-dependent receptor n=1 Tax=Hymenobacter sp. UV11 TaxID=1849735 RepID=UPI0010621BA8|nr:TonB-dependent receptor [Hymenobacter sp. UV11]TDN36133.1 energy transducer TonB [Hymenobacter sp. UV11]TFZ66826.1 TonB-dependent receptor [Hymenobacter sp. UV11]
MFRTFSLVLLGSTVGFSISAAAQAVAPVAADRARPAAFSGRLTDAATNEPLPGANVVFPDLKQGTATDADGRFSFANLPRGRFTVQINSLGYNTVIRTIDTGSGLPLQVGLTPAATEIGQVVVTGVSQATQLRRSPVPTTVVDRTRLNQTSSTNVIDAIAHTPGVSQVTTGAAISKPVVRGLGYNRVVTLNNGAKQEGQQWGDEHGIEIDEFSIDRAEIIKGPGSLLYGSDAMAGVINFLAPDPVADGRIVGTATANYQTNNRQQGYSFQNAGNINGLNWLARGTRKVAGDYQNRYDGRVFNSGFNEWDANGYVGLNKSWGYSHLTFSTFNQNLGLIEGGRDSLSGRFTRDVGVGSAVESRIVTDDELRGYSLFVPRQRINHLRFGTDNNFIIGDKGGRLTLQVNYQQNLRREFGDALAPDTPQLYFQLRTVDYAVRYFLPEMSGWNLAVGTTGLRQQNRNLATEFLIPAYNMTEGGVFGVVKKSFGGLDLSGGLRYDVRRISAQSLYLDANERPTPATTPGAETKFPGFLSTFDNYSGSLGASYAVNDRLTVKGNLSRGFRAPNIAELGANGVHEGTIRYEVGNANLKAETSLQVDAGVSYVTDHVRFSVDAFENSINNYIFEQRVLNRAGTDSLVDVGPPAIGLFNYVQGQARLLGGEVTLDFHPHPLDWLHFENSFSMVRARQLGVPEAEQFLPFIPADRLQSELRGNFRRQGKRLTNVYARFQLEQTFAQNRYFAAFDTETATPAYTLFNAGVGTDVADAKGRTLFSLYVTANNLFDVAYQSHLSRLKYEEINYATGRRGVYNMGRTLSVKVVVPFVFK